MHVTALLLPIAISGVALFFASFLSWMVLKLHEADWKKVGREDEFLAAVRPFQLGVGSYMFPRPTGAEEMKSEAFKARYAAGPRGVMTILAPTNMGANLGLTFAYFLVVSFVVAYLASIGLKPGADFLLVFRFVFAAGLLAFLSAIVQHAIWFRNRIVGHVIESVFYATILGILFGVMWPA